MDGDDGQRIVAMVVMVAAVMVEALIGVATTERERERERERESCRFICNAGQANVECKQNKK